MPKRGPGKFDSDLDALMHELSLEGADEEVGDSGDGPGWAGLLKGDLLADVWNNPELRKKACELDAEEIRELADAVGCIVTESTDGFVGVGLYDDEGDLDDEWEQAQMQYDTGDGEDENDEEDEDEEEEEEEEEEEPEA